MSTSFSGYKQNEATQIWMGWQACPKRKLPPELGKDEIRKLEMQLLRGGSAVFRDAPLHGADSGDGGGLGRARRHPSLGERRQYHTTERVSVPFAVYMRTTANM